MLQELLGKLIVGDRDGTTLWRVAIGEIAYDPITDPAEGVSVATLAENILRCGQLQPILLCRTKVRSDSPSKYRLISGRRRLEALRMLGKTHVSAILVACEEEQIPLVALSDNLLHREPNYIDAAKQIASLIASGWTLTKLAPLLSETVESLEQLLALLKLPADEIRLLKLSSISRNDAIRLLNVPAAMRRAVLERCLSDSACDPTVLINDVARNPDPRIRQSQKVWVTDVRVFLNTVRKAMETMQKAGHDGVIEESEDEYSYRFEICVAKKAGMKLASPSKNVSRETSGNTQKMVSRETSKTSDVDRFASIRNIFEAIAEEECSLGTMNADKMRVSRETSKNPIGLKEENGGKLEKCIDEQRKK